MRSTHVALCSSLPLSLRAFKGEGDQGGEGSPVGQRGIPPEVGHLPYLNSRAILHPRATDLVPRGPSHRKGTRSITRRNSLYRPRPTRALRDRSATDTRLLLPSTFPTRRWKVHRLYAEYPYLGSLLRLRPLKDVLTPGYRPGGRPDTLGSPEAITPRLDSPVASFGTAPFHGDGKEYTPDPFRTVESVWGSYPFLDSPVSSLGDPCSPRDGREFALPSLRMVERFPHTDRPQGETPSSPADLRGWRSLAPWPLHPGHGPSIAYPTLPTAPTFYTVIPDPDRESIPGAGCGRGPLTCRGDRRFAFPGAERKPGVKRQMDFFLKQSKPCLKPQNN